MLARCFMLVNVITIALTSIGLAQKNDYHGLKVKIKEKENFVASIACIVFVTKLVLN